MLSDKLLFPDTDMTMMKDMVGTIVGDMMRIMSPQTVMRMRNIMRTMNTRMRITRRTIMRRMGSTMRMLRVKIIMFGGSILMDRVFKLMNISEYSGYLSMDDE